MDSLVEEGFIVLGGPLQDDGEIRACDLRCV